jgi:hypothetical protein
MPVIAVILWRPTCAAVVFALVTVRLAGAALLLTRR